MPQGLFDALSGAAGHPIDRPGLNAFVANSQAVNGLRSAQTEEALLNAQKAREEQDAQGKVEGQLGALFGPGNESKATATAGLLKSHYGDFKSVLEGMNALQQNQFRQTLGDQGQMGQASQTAAQQGVQGKVAEPVALPNNFTTLPGAPPVVAQQSPEGAAQTADTVSQTHLRNAQTAAGGFNPHAAANAGGELSDDAAFNAAVKYNITGTLPPMGMGASADRKKILEFAAHHSVDPNWTPPSWNNGQAPGAAPVAGHPTAATATNAAANPADYKAGVASLTDMTKRTSVADASEQTALKNLQVAREMLSKADQTGSPLANSIVNKVRSGAFGDPDVSAYQNAISTARNEYARVISMATGAQGITDHAMREGQKLFPDDLAPAQFESNFAVAQREMANRTGSMHQQIAGLKSGLHGGSAAAAPPAGPTTPATITAPTATAPMSLDDYLKARGH